MILLDAQRSLDRLASHSQKLSSLFQSSVCLQISTYINQEKYLTWMKSATESKLAFEKLRNSYISLVILP